MRHPNLHHRTSRRGFFKLAAILGTTTVGARLGIRRADAKSAAGKNARTQSRYRSTAHIRNYYRRAAL